MAGSRGCNGELSRAQPTGSIINIITGSAKVGLPNRTPLVSTRCGLHGLTQNVARKLHPFSIRVNSVFPGTVDNPHGRELIEKQAMDKKVSVAQATERSLSFISMRTMVQADEFAKQCVFLASFATCHVSGQEISVEGNLEWDT